MLGSSRIVACSYPATALIQRSVFASPQRFRPVRKLELCASHPLSGSYVRSPSDQAVAILVLEPRIARTPLVTSDLRGDLSGLTRQLHSQLNLPFPGLEPGFPATKVRASAAWSASWFCWSRGWRQVAASRPRPPVWSRACWVFCCWPSPGGHGGSGLDRMRLRRHRSGWLQSMNSVSVGP